MAKRPKWDVLRLLKQIKAGVDRPGHLAARRSELTKSIEESLSSSTLDSLFDVALDLDGLGVVEGAAGVVGIWQEESSGWPLLQTSFAFMSWNVRIVVG